MRGSGTGRLLCRGSTVRARALGPAGAPARSLWCPDCTIHALRENSRLSFTPSVRTDGKCQAAARLGSGGRGDGSAERPAGAGKADAGPSLEAFADLLDARVEARLVHEGLAVGVDHHPAVDHHGVHAAAVGVVDEVV